MIRKASFAGVAAILAVVAVSNLPAARIVEKVIARINNEIVTQRQFERQKEQLRAELGRQYSGAELEVQLREQSKNLLRDLIDQDLMVQKAKDDDINVDADVIKRLEEMRVQYKLNSQEELQKEVERQGLIWEDFQDQIKRNLLMREVIGREVASRITVSHDEARKYFNEHKEKFASPEGVALAEILIATDKHTPAEVEQRTKEALDEIKSGQRFSEVAKKYSDDEHTASEGGDVGFFKTGTLSSELDAAVKKLETNDTSDAIKTKYGNVIVKLLERREAGVPKFDDIVEQVRGQMIDQRIQSSLRQYLVDLRKQSYVQLAPGYIDTGAERPSEAVAANQMR